MTRFKSAWDERQLKRGMRPDAGRFLRPDWKRHARPGAEREFLTALYDRKYSPEQPRVPAGNPRGGEWTTVSSGGGISIALPLAGLLGDLTGEFGDLGGVSIDAGGDAGFDAEDFDFDGIQLAGDIPSGDRPEIPEERPSTTRGLNRAARLAARRIPALGLILEAYPYLSERQAEIGANFDPPKTLEELQDAASTPKKGYDIHHVVEKATGKPDGSEDFLIDAPENLVRIPRFRHWELNRWYETENENFNGLTPRQYLKDKSWDERRRVGLSALRQVGVLK